MGVQVGRLHGAGRGDVAHRDRIHAVFDEQPRGLGLDQVPLAAWIAHGCLGNERSFVHSPTLCRPSSQIVEQMCGRADPGAGPAHARSRRSILLARAVPRVLRGRTPEKRHDPHADGEEAGRDDQRPVRAGDERVRLLHERSEHGHAEDASGSARRH